jgi:hypothetical protein
VHFFDAFDDFQGQQLPIGHSRKTSLQWLFSEEEYKNDELTAAPNLYYCEEKNAPAYYGRDGRHTFSDMLIRFIVKFLCGVTVNASSMKSFLEKKYGKNNSVYYKLSATVEVTFSGPELVFTWSRAGSGAVQGRAVAKYQ